MAPLKPSGEHDSGVQSLQKLITTLKSEKNPPKSRVQAYNSMVQSVQQGKFGTDTQQFLASVDITMVLKDVSASTDDLCQASLSFLGALLQLVKIPTEKQAEVIQSLAAKADTVRADKAQSRKVMWCLANLQIDKDLTNEDLKLMLDTALSFLNDIHKPVLSLSTVCESLNTLLNLSNRNRSFILSSLSSILPSVTPWLFYEVDRTRQLSLSFLQPLAGRIADERLLDAPFQAQLRERYRNDLMQLVASENPTTEALDIWSFLITAFGKVLHDSVALLNDLLKVEESALKSKNMAFRQKALEHWRYIIDCFALNPAVLDNSKRIKLILVPLKSTDTKTAELSETKMKLWWYLLDQLGPDASKRFNEVTRPLLEFCFGQPPYPQTGPTVKGTALIFQARVMPLAASMLASILSEEEVFEAGGIRRSYPFLTPEDFRATAEQLGQIALLILGNKPAEDRPGAYRTLLRSYLDRCTALPDQEALKVFVRSLLNLVTDKSGLMGLVLDVLGDFISKAPSVLPVLADNAGLLLGWYAENEPLPNHPMSTFLAQLCQTGLEQDPTGFSVKFLDILPSISSGQMTITLVAKLASALSTLPADKLILADKRAITLPLTGQLEALEDESSLAPWVSLVAAWAKADPTILASVFNPLGLEEDSDADLKTVRFVLKALRAELTVDAFSTQLTDLIQRWASSWTKRTDARQSRADSATVLAEFLLAVSEESERSLAEWIIKELHSILREMQPLSSDVLDALQGAIGPAATAVKAPAVSKLRKVGQPKSIKTLAELLPAKKTPAKGAKPADDFVVIAPSPKTGKRVLTEHQKEVRSSKRHSSAMPAMYNDLSQSSMPSMMAETQPSLMDCDPSSPIIITSVSSLVDMPAEVEEAAMMGPPSPKKIVPDEAAVAAAAASQDKENPAAVGDLFKKDLKLRSKVSVEVTKLSSPAAELTKAPTRKSSRQSASAAESPVAGTFSKPCPKSKKPGYVPPPPPPADEKADEVEEPMDVVEEEEEVKVPSVVEAEEKVVDIQPSEAEETPEGKEETFSGTSRLPPPLVPIDSEPLVADPAPSAPAEEPSPAPVMEAPAEEAAAQQQPSTSVTEPTAPPAPSATAQRSKTVADPRQMKQLLLAKAIGPRKRSASGAPTGPSPSTSKRGAQMLELSRKKIQQQEEEDLNSHQPPVKKAKMAAASSADAAEPEESAAEISKGAKLLDFPATVVVTPEGSPARKVPWLPKTYSPYASPSTGILKKGHVSSKADEAEEQPSSAPESGGSPVSSATKSRRVSFADPEVSHSVKISPHPSRRFSRSKSRRVLIPSTASESAPEGAVEMEEVAVTLNPPDEEEDAAPIDRDADNTIGSELANFVSSAVPEVFASSQKPSASEADESPIISLESTATPEEQVVTGSPDSCPNGQIIGESVEMDPCPVEDPACPEDLVNSPSALDTPEDSDDGSSNSDQPPKEVLVPVNPPPPTVLKEEEEPMPAEALLDLIDKHPEKDRIFLSMVNRYLAINVTLNGKVLDLSSLIGIAKQPDPSN